MKLALLKLNPSPEKRKETLEILHSLQGPLRAQKDCRDCIIYEDHDGSGEILYMELWEDPEALNRYIQSDIFLRILAVIDIADEAPEIFFTELADTNGMDLIRKLRA